MKLSFFFCLHSYTYPFQLENITHYSRHRALGMAFTGVILLALPLQVQILQSLSRCTFPKYQFGFAPWLKQYQRFLMAVVVAWCCLAILGAGLCCVNHHWPLLAYTSDSE